MESLCFVMDSLWSGSKQVAEAMPDRLRAATLAKPFLVTHPFGEQCFLHSWDRPVHGTLMFGGVVFGKALMVRGSLPPTPSFLPPPSCSPPPTPSLVLPFSHSLPPRV